MSEDTSKMEVDSPPTTDIAALKEVAKEKLEKSESDPKSENGDNKVNGAITNGDSNGTGNGDSHESDEDGEEAEVEAPGEGEQSENGDKTSKEDEEVETITSSPMQKTPKKGDNSDVSPRRSGRKKTPTKYQELLEAERESSEEEIEEVEEIKDDDSDIQEVEADDSPLTAGGSVTITPKNSNSSQKKPNVVTIDDLKTLQKLATTAKASMDREKSDRASVLDTQSIIAGKMGSGVSITPAKPKTPAP